MKTKNYFFLAIILLFFSSHCTDHVEKFYSTRFLKKHLAVRRSLQQCGFEDVTFKTNDGLTLSGLLLVRPNATCNVIVCAGWRPGRKEGMATFYPLLPENCNILFFDGRGRGDSEGPVLQGLSRYGINEYKDITGAITYINQTNNLPIFLIGLCSGAFNAAHALIHLEKQNKTETCGIRGLIFDSGWSSVIETARTSSIANVNKIIVVLLKLIYRKKEQCKKSYLYKILSSCNYYCLTILHKLCIEPIITQYEPITNLTKKINTITVPIFFIHSYDDELTPIKPVIKLSQLTLHKECWWIKQSSHTLHHIIHRDLYREKLAHFIDAAIR